jgi:uncharacterized protein YaaR (DUF327 family)
MAIQNPLAQHLGISLLPLFSFSMQLKGKQLLSEVLACHDAQESRAWVRFIRYFQLHEEPENLSIWKTFLEGILEKGHIVSSSIQNAAIDRYKSLILLQEDVMAIDEHKLGLPWSNENS